MRYFWECCGISRLLVLQVRWVDCPGLLEEQFKKEASKRGLGHAYMLQRTPMHTPSHLRAEPSPSWLLVSAVPAWLWKVGLGPHVGTRRV